MTLLSDFKEEIRNLFFIDVHKILWSEFGCIEADFYFKAAINKSLLMEVALLASMRIEVGFDQGPSMNGINFKIICRCYGRNLFKDPDDDDDEGFVSSFTTLEDAMLALPMAKYYYRLKSVVMFGTKNSNTMKFIRNRFLHHLSREEEELDFDHI